MKTKISAPVKEGMRMHPGRYRVGVLTAIAALLVWAVASSGQADTAGASAPGRALWHTASAPAGATAEAKQDDATMAYNSPNGESNPFCRYCYPAVASNSTSGEYLVVWEDESRGSTDEIYGQIVSSSGALVGSEFPISTAPGNQSRPRVAYNSTANEYLVVWSDSRADLYGQRVSSSGAMLGSEISISTASDSQTSPDVAYNSTSNEYLVAWSDYRGGTYYSNLYGQRISGSGAMLGSEIPISAASNSQVGPRVAYNSTSNEYLVAWLDYRGGSYSDIYGQRISGSGAMLGSEIPISTAANHQFLREVVYNSTGNEYMVVWDDQRVSQQGDIYGQRISSSGALLGSEIPISTAPDSQSTPDVAYNSTGNEYLVVWIDSRPSSGNQVYGQRISGSGALVGSDFPISAAPGNQFDPALAYNSVSNEYLVVWDDWRSLPSNLYGQRVSGSGALAGSEFPITRAAGATPTVNPATHTPVPPTQTPGGPTATPGACSIEFSDVPPGSTFYPFVRCLACRGILGGYDDNTFRPQNLITRGQIAKIVSNAAGYSDDVSGRQTYADVPSTQPFHVWIERLSMRGHMSGYACGGAGEACDGANRPYFHPGSNATRGQLSKIVSNAAEFEDTPAGQSFEDVSPSSPFYLYIERLTSRGVMSGYPCGGAGEPCGGGNRPYFRPGDNVTRGQASKIVANTFFPNCEASAGK